eukprot:2370228-Pyramimonas_sp.AAC.1
MRQAAPSTHRNCSRTGLQTELRVSGWDDCTSTGADNFKFGGGNRTTQTSPHSVHRIDNTKYIELRRLHIHQARTT